MVTTGGKLIFVRRGAGRGIDPGRGIDQAKNKARYQEFISLFQTDQIRGKENWITTWEGIGEGNW